MSCTETRPNPSRERTSTGKVLGPRAYGAYIGIAAQAPFRWCPLSSNVSFTRGRQVTLEWKHSTDGIDWEELSALYRAAPLGEKPPLHLQKVFSNSMFQCFVYDNAKLVAAGRALADGGDCSYICDIAVLPSHQSTGLGKQVVSDLVEMSRGHKKIILYAVPGKEPFYRKFGFMRMKTAMAIFENQQQQVERGYLSEV